MDRDGRNLRQVTNTGVGANWAPFFTPDGTKIIYGSNAKNPRGNNFDLFLINVDGTGLEQVTHVRRLRRVPDVLARRRGSSSSRRTGTRRRKETRTCSSRTGWDEPARLPYVKYHRVRRNTPLRRQRDGFGEQGDDRR